MITCEQEKQIRSLSPQDKAKVWAGIKNNEYNQNPFKLITEGRFYIKTKAGTIVKFVLNKAQQHILTKILELWQQNKPIRLIVLKARQVGSTTLFMSIIYALVSRRTSQSAAVIADEKGKANDIFEMAKLFWERCLECWRPQIKRSNERKLEFDKIHSQISIDTAENKDAGRSATLRFVILSEFAYYRTNNAVDIMLGISHSVPSLPETMIIKESTANGYNHFKEDWDSAVAGENDYVPIFVPWYWDEGYKMALEPHFVIGDPALGELTEDEPELYKQMAREGITDIEERLQWRRWDIKNNCNGDVEKFKQEDPSTDIEAFLASGQCFFDQKKLVKELNRSTPPLFCANIVKENYKWVVRKCDDGDFMFWEEPNPYGDYCIGGDACSGSGEDYACLIVLNKETNNTAAVFHAKVDGDELAYRAMQLGFLFNTAKVAIENEKFGFAANKKLHTLYPNIYLKKTYNRVDNKYTEELGWATNSVTRPMMLTQLQMEIREGSTDLRYAGTVKKPGLIRECLTFIKNPESGRAEAEQSKHDDVCISRAIAGQLRHEQPYVRKEPRDEAVRRSYQHEAVDRRDGGLKFKRRN